MAFICDDCQYIFSKKRSSCPFCGSRVYNNSSSESTLLNEGYSWAPGQNSKEANKNAEVSHDHFEDLRQSFFEQQESDTSQNSTPEVAPRVAPPKSKPKNSPRELTNTNPESDFFSQFGGHSSHADDIPIGVPQVQQTQTQPPRQPDSYEQELQELERQRQRAERQYRRRAALNSILNIRWRAVFRIIMIILIVVAGITVWNMRYVIFNSIIDFFISLLPIILIIWIMWYLIRSFFQ